MILNKTRNKLYLTHGEEDLPTGYYSQRVRDRRGTDPNYLQTECKELFEIVCFLTTGEACDWGSFPPKIVGMI